MDSASLAENAPQITRIVLYVKDIAKVASFYQRLFAMRPLPGATEGWLELASLSGGCTIALHQAAKSQKSGAAVKIVFGERDVRAFKSRLEKLGLKCGVLHEPEGFEFFNAKDPAGNSISVSSRGMNR